MKQSRKNIKKITFVGDYGGLGKVGFSLSQALNISIEKNMSVLFIDLYDDQRNTKQVLNLKEINDSQRYVLPIAEDVDVPSKITDIFYDDPVIPYNTSFSDNLKFIPTDGASREVFEYLEITKKNNELEFMSFCMEEQFNKKEISENFDFVVFDAPLENNAVGMAGISISDIIIVPIKINENSVLRLRKALHLIETAANIGNNNYYQAYIVTVNDDISDECACSILADLKAYENQRVKILNFNANSDMLLSAENLILGYLEQTHHKIPFKSDQNTVTLTELILGM